jgi:hypothetical protein
MKIFSIVNDFIKGYRTYFMVGCGLGVIGAWMLGQIDLETANMLLGTFGLGSIAALRAAK